MEKKKKMITILIPAYNEEESLPPLFERLNTLMDDMKDYDFELLFINDGSKDKTIDIIKEHREKDKRVSYVNFARNFGKEIGMLAGLDYAKGDCVVIMDADLQDPPELIPEMVKYWEEGYDDVYAQRNSRKGETFLKKFTSKMYYRVLQKMTRVPIQKDTGDFRLLDRRVVNALRLLRENGRCSKSLFSWVGYKKKAVFYDRDPRIAGTTKWNYKRLVDLAIDGITAFTTSPLRISLGVAVPTGLAFFIYLIYVIVHCIVTGLTIKPFEVIILLMLFFFAALFTMLGVIGEYLGRIFIDSKNRPIYLVDEYNGVREENILKEDFKH